MFADTEEGGDGGRPREFGDPPSPPPPSPLDQPFLQSKMETFLETFLVKKKIEGDQTHQLCTGYEGPHIPAPPPAPPPGTVHTVHSYPA